MFPNISILSFLLTSLISSALTSIPLSSGRLHTDSISNSKLKYYTIDLPKNHQKDLAIESSLLKYDQSTKLPIMILSTKPLPNTDQSSQWICGSLAKEKCVIPKEYFSNSKQISLGIFCEECQYSLKVSYEDNKEIKLITQRQNELRKLVSLPTVRLLQGAIPVEGTESFAAAPETATPTAAPVAPDSPTTVDTVTPTIVSTPIDPLAQTASDSTLIPTPYSTKTLDDKLNELRGAGIAGLILGIMFIICIFIGYYMHVVIYVNTKFVDQPLKLGKTE